MSERLADERDEGDNGGGNYILRDADRVVVDSAKLLLWKIAHAPFISAVQLEVVAKALQVFDRLPAGGEYPDLMMNLNGPRRWYGEHEIWHWWEVTVESSGFIQVMSGGHFYRKSTGGDSFTAMQWQAYPGAEADLGDYLHTLGIVDDAQPFPDEVKGLRLDQPGYSLSVSIDSEDVGVPEGEEDEDDAGNGDPPEQPPSTADDELAALMEEPPSEHEPLYAAPAPEKCDLCGGQLASRRYTDRD